MKNRPPPTCLFCRDEGTSVPATVRIRGGPVYTDDSERAFPLHAWLCERHFQDCTVITKVLERR